MVFNAIVAVSFIVVGNHRPVASHLQTLSHNVVSSTLHLHVRYIYLISNYLFSKIALACFSIINCSNCFSNSFSLFNISSMVDWLQSKIRKHVQLWLIFVDYWLRRTFLPGPKCWRYQRVVRSRSMKKYRQYKGQK